MDQWGNCVEGRRNSQHKVFMAGAFQDCSRRLCVHLATLLNTAEGFQGWKQETTSLKSYWRDIIWLGPECSSESDVKSLDCGCVVLWGWD